MRVLTGDKGLEREITGVYVCDLLSWVMSHANKGDAWITVQTHLNTVAVAVLLEIPCIIVPEGIKVEEATIKKASEENIVVLSSEMSAYEICWRAHEILH
ncbi:MAG: AraC family transcriptional regulator [Firmicutes bacterium]|nr:AraC family transcriptional regulator [Bacillota bacterium]